MSKPTHEEARWLIAHAKETNKVEWLAGWDSGRNYGKLCAEERIVKLLREKAKHLKQVSESISMDDYMSEWDAAVPENGAFALNEFADALIKGEQK